jgi:transcriptional regulator of met regulon
MDQLRHQEGYSEVLSKYCSMKIEMKILKLLINKRTDRQKHQLSLTDSFEEVAKVITSPSESAVAEP